jgi:hypothetical protein
MLNKINNYEDKIMQFFGLEAKITLCFCTFCDAVKKMDNNAMLPIVEQWYNEIMQFPQNYE